MTGFLSRFRRNRNTPRHALTANGRALRVRFSSSAVGLISNYCDPVVNLSLIQHMTTCGVRRLVYSGPLGILDDPRELWKLIESGQVRWVYGHAERPRSAPEVGILPPGSATIEENGVLFRHFVRQAEEEEPVRFGALQWPPPGGGQRDAITKTLEGVENRIVVVGSGLEYERWVWNKVLGRWELYEQNVPGYAETSMVQLSLDTDQRHVIISPTSRSSYCSVIDPEANTYTLLMV